MASRPARSRNRPASHYRNASTGAFFSGWFGNQPRLATGPIILPSFDPEKLTEEERLSRLLHSPPTSVTIPGDGSLIENFVVIGEPFADQPEVLFVFPQSKALAFPSLADFCMPPKQLIVDRDEAQIGENEAVVVLTDESGNMYYAVNIYRMENDNKRCYSFLSRFPYFDLHFAVLHDVISCRGINTLVRGLPSSTSGSELLDILRFHQTSRLRQSKTLDGKKSLRMSPQLPQLPSLVPSPRQSRPKPPDSQKSSPPALAAAAANKPAVSPPQPQPARLPIRLGIPLPARSTSHPTSLIGSGDTATGPAVSPSPPDGSPTKSPANSSPPPSKTDPPQPQPQLPAVVASPEAVASAAAAQSQPVAAVPKKLSPALQESKKPRAASLVSVKAVNSTVPGPGKAAQSKQSQLQPHQAQEQHRQHIIHKELAVTGIFPRLQPSELPKFLTPRDAVSLEGSTTLDQTAVEETIDESALKRSKSMPDLILFDTSVSRTAEEKKASLIAVSVARILVKLEQYAGMPLPKPREPTLFVTEKKPISFTRPNYDDCAGFMVEWALPQVFGLVPKRLLFKLLSCVLLEKKLAIVGTNMRQLSSVILALSSLIRPFKYSSRVITYLPEKMEGFLDAPVPLLVGLGAVPATPFADALLFDLHKLQFIGLTDKIPHLPGEERLDQLLTPLLEEIKRVSKTFSRGRTMGTNEELINLCVAAAAMVEAHFSAVFENFQSHCVSDRTDMNNPVSVFVKETFLAEQSGRDSIFLSKFFETMTFNQYCDQFLREIDSRRVIRVIISGSGQEEEVEG